MALEDGKMEMDITHTTGMQFLAKTRDHEITIDLPESYKGKDTGPTPPELFIAGFGSCVGVYALMYLKAQGLPTEGLKVTMNWEEVEGGRRIGKITADLDLPEGISPEQARMTLKAAEACKIHNTLAQKPEICVSIAEKPEICLS